MRYADVRAIKRLCFGYEELARVLAIRPASARVFANRYVASGFLVRLKRNVYLLRERWQVLSDEDRFTLANLVQVPSYVSLMTALGYYGVTTQIQRDFVESISIHRTKEITVDGVSFSYTKLDRTRYGGFLKMKRWFIATPEKAFLDAVYLKTLRRYLFDMSSVDMGKLNRAKLFVTAKQFPSAVRKEVDRLWMSYKGMKHLK